MKQFDVIVVGGGHAGVEAADAAHRMGARTALVTFKAKDLGLMSCNPAIGGVGKGHLVREIDALDGVMGRAADYAGIQFRLLNRRKGPAVQGPRAQTDRCRYQNFVQSYIEGREYVQVIEAEVTALAVRSGRVGGVTTAAGDTLLAGCVILTTGTFLRGRIHIGDKSFEGGRIGNSASSKLAKQIDDFGLPTGRLKTGTPPRLDGRTIDWSGLECQPGDDTPEMFSFLSSGPCARQVSCGITHTNPQTHAIIAENLHRSAMYGGHIESTGPRYCPSIEDKVVRFSDKLSHQIFLEPEGLDTNTVYPNGISTSLPREAQENFVRSIRGLETAEITQPGYAIEYDFLDPTCLSLELELRVLPGLYLAGQINGTTGYEEAAAQGVIAGLNAALRSMGMEGVRFGRADGYIGVMIDDLVSRGVTEPYRMFTSRAEYRLSLRADNADERLTPIGIELGCVSDVRRSQFERKMTALAGARERLQRSRFSPQELVAAGFQTAQDGALRSSFDLLGLADVEFKDLFRVAPELRSISPEIQLQLSRDAVYRKYLERQESEIASLRSDEAKALPDDIDYAGMSGLSAELRGKLARRKPRSIAEAARIDGMTPSALVLLLGHARSGRLRSAG